MRLHHVAHLIAGTTDLNKDQRHMAIEFVSAAMPGVMSLRREVVTMVKRDAAAVRQQQNVAGTIAIGARVYGRASAPPRG
jgi:hypothetical protein